MCDAPVSTNASHLRLLEESRTLSILTEATILPIGFPILIAVWGLMQQISPLFDFRFQFLDAFIDITEIRGILKNQGVNSI